MYLWLLSDILYITHRHWIGEGGCGGGPQYIGVSKSRRGKIGIEINCEFSYCCSVQTPYSSVEPQGAFLSSTVKTFCFWFNMTNHGIGGNIYIYIYIQEIQVSRPIKHKIEQFGLKGKCHKIKCWPCKTDPLLPKLERSLMPL